MCLQCRCYTKISRAQTCLLHIARYASKGVLDLGVAIEADISRDPATCLAASKHIHEGGLASACISSGGIS